MDEERWKILEEGLQKAELILDGRKVNEVFTPQEYMHYYDCVYHICSRNPYSRELLNRFKKALDDGIVSKVVPYVMDKDGIDLVTVFLQHWRNYKMMANCLTRFFHYLDRQLAERDIGIPRLVHIPFRSFHELVLKHLDQRLIPATVSLITEQRNGVQIDEHLLPGISKFFVEFGEHGYKPYLDMFEEEIQKDAASFYSHVASVWYPVYSSTDYLLKVEQCLYEEKVRANKFLRQSSITKLLQVVFSEMVDRYDYQLAEKHKAANMDSSLFLDLIERCSNLRLG